MYTAKITLGNGAYGYLSLFPHPILPTVKDEPDYQTIHAIRKLLQANARSIDTHLGGGALGHMGLIVSDASYDMIAPATEAGPTLWESPTDPGCDPGNKDGTAAQISAARHTWNEEVQTYRTFTSVQQALKKQIITVFESMHLDVLNEDMVGFANITTRAMLDHLLSPMTTSLRSTWRITLNTCTAHGFPNNLLNPCSNKFKIALTIQRQEVFLLGILRKSTWDMQKSLQLGSL
jgi:hypothetical protein